jgi:hypothetical protein
VPPVLHPRYQPYAHDNCIVPRKLLSESDALAKIAEIVRVFHNRRMRLESVLFSGDPLRISAARAQHHNGWNRCIRVVGNLTARVKNHDILRVSLIRRLAAVRLATRCNRMNVRLGSHWSVAMVKDRTSLMMVIHGRNWFAWVEASGCLCVPWRQSLTVH